MQRELYLRSKIEYPINNMGEDGALVVQILWYANKISYLPEALYFYYNNPTSITNDITDEKIRRRFIQATTNVGIIKQFLVDKSSKKINDALTKYIFEQSSLIVSLAKRNKEDLKKWRVSIDNIKSLVYKSPYLSIKNKLVFYLLLFKSKYLK